MKRAVLLAALLAGCAATPPLEEPAQRRGGYYKDDGPPEKPPASLAEVPDAQPKAEPLHRFANRPYQVFGTEYVPLARVQAFRQRGLASWYGKRFHGQRTASGEPYDMYAMTAAHPTLPIPSYVRVTHLANGRSVVVRVNDRGPFHPGRIIDLSYAAAYRLGFAAAGSAEVEIESIVPHESAPAAGPELYLQLGAFASREKADVLHARVTRELGWLEQTLQVSPGGELWRLHVGPYPSRDAAQAVGERIEAELELKAFVVLR